LLSTTKVDEMLRDILLFEFYLFHLVLIPSMVIAAWLMSYWRLRRGKEYIVLDVSELGDSCFIGSMFLSLVIMSELFSVFLDLTFIEIGLETLTVWIITIIASLVSGIASYVYMLKPVRRLSKLRIFLDITINDISEIVGDCIRAVREATISKIPLFEFIYLELLKYTYLVNSLSRVDPKIRSIYDKILSVSGVQRMSPENLQEVRDSIRGRTSYLRYLAPITLATFIILVIYAALAIMTKIIPYYDSVVGILLAISMMGFILMSMGIESLEKVILETLKRPGVNMSDRNMYGLGASLLMLADRIIGVVEKNVGKKVLIAGMDRHSIKSLMTELLNKAGGKLAITLA